MSLKKTAFGAVFALLLPASLAAQESGETTVNATIDPGLAVECTATWGTLVARSNKEEDNYSFIQVKHLRWTMLTVFMLPQGTANIAQEDMEAQTKSRFAELDAEYDASLEAGGETSEAFVKGLNEQIAACQQYENDNEPLFALVDNYLQRTFAQDEEAAAAPEG